MKGINRWNALMLLTLVEGAAAIFFYFYLPSESSNAGWGGYSISRWLVGGVVIGIWIGLVIALVYSRRKPEIRQRLCGRANDWLENGHSAWKIRFILLAGLLASLEAFLLTFLSFPAHLRPLFIWAGVVFIQSLGWSFWFYRKPLDLLSGWRSLEHGQQVTFLILVGLALLFFLIIIPQNLRGAETPHIFNVAVNDENVTYQPLVWMLSFSGKPEEWIYRLIVYEDYHYGYPFYMLSALALLPVRLIFGVDFGEQTQLNLLILRQVVSSLPVLLASLLLVWMNTRFKSRAKSILLFLLILFIPNAAFYQIRFWHPDGLVVLAAVFTLFFLERDRYRLGWNFTAAAIACGLTAAIKLYGFFFIVAIPVYLGLAHFYGKAAWRKLFSSAVIFVAVMFATILLANPFLGVPSALERMVQIQTEKSALIGQGYSQPNAEDIYHVGLDAWLPFLEAGFGPSFYLGFLALSLVIGSGLGKKRLLNIMSLCWVAALAFYLINFSAVKSEHYWLPAMLPLYGTALTLSNLSAGDLPGWLRLPQKLVKWLGILTIVLAVLVLIFNLIATRSVFTNIFIMDKV